MQVAFYFAGEITQVLDAIPWVHCASGNVKFFMLLIGCLFQRCLCCDFFDNGLDKDLFDGSREYFYNATDKDFYDGASAA